MKKVFLFVSLLVMVSFLANTRFERRDLVIKTSKEVIGYTYKFNVSLNQVALAWVTPLGEVPITYYW